MGLNSIMKIFMPKDRVFYTLFEQVADTMAKMGKMLKEVVKEPDFDKRAGADRTDRGPRTRERRLYPPDIY